MHACMDQCDRICAHHHIILEYMHVCLVMHIYVERYISSSCVVLEKNNVHIYVMCGHVMGSVALVDIYIRVYWFRKRTHIMQCL